MTPVDAGEQFSITVQATDAGGLYTQGIIEVMVIPGPNLGGPVFLQDEYGAEVRIIPIEGEGEALPLIEEQASSDSVSSRNVQFIETELSDLCRSPKDLQSVCRL